MNIERAVALVIGVAVIIYGFLAYRFYPGALGVGDRTRTIPKWFGRFWFAAIGLWFIDIGLKLGSTVLVERILIVAMGVSIIIAGFTTSRIESDIPSVLRQIKASPGKFGVFWPLAIGLLLNFIGLMMRG